jgi:hypothetical protein
MVDIIVQTRQTIAAEGVVLDPKRAIANLGHWTGRDTTFVDNYKPYRINFSRSCTPKQFTIFFIWACKRWNILLYNECDWAKKGEKLKFFNPHKIKDYEGPKQQITAGDPVCTNSENYAHAEVITALLKEFYHT